MSTIPYYILKDTDVEQDNASANYVQFNNDNHVGLLILC